MQNPHRRSLEGDLISELFDCRQLDRALDLVLSGALQLQGTSLGNMQLFNPEQHALEIVRQNGFKREFLDFFHHVSTEHSCACGRALQNRSAIVSNDVDQDPDFAPYLSVMRAAGVRAVQSTPLITSTGKLIGVVSTHFREPGIISAVTMKATEVFARQAAEVFLLIEAEESERRLGSTRH
jgi:GAF domain-containing protein